MERQRVVAVEAALPDDLAGVRLDRRYRLHLRIGGPLRAPLWQATDERLRRPVVVQLLDPTSPWRQEVARTICRASLLTDDRLARILDVNEESEPPYVVTEWVPGPSMADLLVAGPLDTPVAVDLVVEAARALGSAHAAGLAHLGLDPGSVVCSDAGIVKVLGTGIRAAVLGSDTGDAARTDTCGLGLLLLAALTGCWEGGDQLGGARSRVGRANDPPIDQDLDDIVHRAIGDDRHTGAPILTPADLADALAPFRPLDSALRQRAVSPVPACRHRRVIVRMAREVMETDVVIVTEDTPVVELAAILARTGCHAVPVVDASGHVTGVVTADDLAGWRPATVPA
ncbi:MAG TPA: CBS domain-containing protein [Kribbella sp.]|nr:CBS domain-containing protein [Kribbella sp.]